MLLNDALQSSQNPPYHIQCLSPGNVRQAYCCGLCKDHSKVLCLPADVTALDINPQGATPAYAAPELLRSLQLHRQGAEPADPGLLINGPSADWWAISIVLFELLTGELPFCGKAATKAPECIDSLCKEQWEEYEGVLQAHQSWVSLPLLTASQTSSIYLMRWAYQMIGCVSDDRETSKMCKQAKLW